MPSNTHKSAAVPFINQKGERSMKRVKVERYVAGKRPAYAKDDDDEEYYITEDEDEDDLEDEEAEDDDDTNRAFRAGRKLDYGRQDSDDDDDDDSSSGNEKATESSEKKIVPSPRIENNDQDEDSDEEDPRFRRLKQIESRAGSSHLIEVQKVKQIQPKQELKNVILDEDDDEDEIRQRHAAARLRQVEVPVGRSRLDLDPLNTGDIKPEDDDDSQDGLEGQSKRMETDDLLKDLKLTGITRPMREKLKTKEDEMEEKQRMRALIEQAKAEASFTRQTIEKINEDIKKEVEKEALAKGDIGAREMTSVCTDDEDDEIAYEEWKLREIQRVLRDRSERRPATSAR